MVDSFSKKFPKTRIFLVTLLIFTHSFIPSYLFAASQDSREYVLKAGYIYNFTKFIKWPERAIQEIENKGLNFCVVGKDPFGNILAKFAKNLQKNNKNLLITLQVSNEKMHQCHILFVSQSEKSKINQFLQRVREYPVLVIGDTPGFGKKGIGINFFLQKNKIRFEINREALERAGLVASSELLNLARIVKGRE